MRVRNVFCFAALFSAAVSFGQDPVKMAPLGQMNVPSVVGRSVLVSHADPAKVLHITLSLPYADPNGIAAFNDDVSDPTSPNFRHFLTPAQVGQRFGVTTDQLSAVESYLQLKGFTIRLVASNRLGILADCTVAQAENAFVTKINNYHAINASEPGRLDYYSYSTRPQMPDTLTPFVVGISGLQNFTKPKPMQTSLTPSMARQLYGVSTWYNAGYHGEGRNVAITNFDGYRLTNVPLFYAKYALPTPTAGVLSNVHHIPINGGDDGTLVTAAGEGDLDIQMILGEAPLCNFYIYDGSQSGDILGLLTKETNDNLADIISESYGFFFETIADYTTAHNLHQSMTAQGITFLAAAGDSGTFIEPFSYPDMDPEVLIVGGTGANTDTAGNRISESTWAFGGGGWSTVAVPFNIRPSWQKGNGVPSNVNRRMIPDISAAADFGCFFDYFGGNLEATAGGTSYACPVMAGGLAISEQHTAAIGGIPLVNGHRRIGRFQDLIYRVNGNPKYFFDVITGNNGPLPNGVLSTARTGWDTATGWGAINWGTMPLEFIIITNPPTLVAVPEGGGLDGWGWINTLDGQYFSIKPSTESAGQAASASFKYTLPPTVSRGWVQSLDFKLSSKFASGSTAQIYMFNYVTGKWDVLKSFPLTSSVTTVTASLRNSFTTYMSAAGEYRILVRALMPTSSGITGNTFDIDQLTSTAAYVPQ